MKHRLFIVVVVFVLLLTGCSGGSYTDPYTDSYGISSNTASVDSYESSDYDYDYTSDYDNKSEDYSNNNNEYTEQDLMLVYNCNIRIDTTSFDDSLIQLNSLIKEYKGYKENEYFTDGADTYGYYYVDEEEKHRSVSMNIRIPAAKYDEFLIACEDLGEMRSKDSSIENVTSSYNSAETALEIYKAKRLRYLDRLTEVNDDALAVAIENELTELDIKIAQLESTTTNIENSVSYSFIDLTLREVIKEEIVEDEDESFVSLIKKTFSTSIEQLLSAIKFSILVLVYASPLLVISIIVFLVIFIPIRVRKRHKKKSVNIPDEDGKVL